MNFLFLIDNNRNTRGGSFSIFKFADLLKNRGHNVKIVCNYNPSKGILSSGFTDLKVLPSFLHLLRNFTILYLFSKILFLFFQINKIKKDNYDCVLGHQLDSGIMAAVISKILNLQYSLFIFETPSWLSRTYWTSVGFDIGRFSYLAKWKIFIGSLFGAKSILANSKMTRNNLIDDFPKIVNKVKVAYPSFNFNPEFILSNSKKMNYIIYVGALVKHKNVDQLIIQLSSIKDSPALIIVGDGYMKNSLKRLSQELNVRAKFYGNVSESKKNFLISNSLAMIFPTSFEGFGMPPMEAVINGVPCLCSDIPILKEVYSDNMYYFKQGNWSDLKSSIIKLLSDVKNNNVDVANQYKNLVIKYGQETSAFLLEKNLK